MANPNLSEITTTTQRNRSAKVMPVGPTHTKAQKQKVVHTEMRKFKKGSLHSGSKHGPVVTNPKQAVAIAMSESGQSKPKHDSKSYDRSGHHPGNPGFNREGAPPYHKYDAGRHGEHATPHSTGEHDSTKHKPHQSYFAEQREHWGNQAEGKNMGSSKEFGKVGTGSRGSSLEGKYGMGHDAQNDGHSVGNGMKGDSADHHKSSSFGGAAHAFTPPKAGNAHGYRHTSRSGFYRLSGHSGAHRVGHRSK